MRSFLLLSALALLHSTLLAADVVLSILPQAQAIMPGTNTSVQIQISGLGAGSSPSLGAFDVNLAFDPTVIAFSGLTFGDPVLGDQLSLSSVPAISDFNLSSPGSLELYSISLDPPNLLDINQAGQFVLATLGFQAIAPGGTGLTLSINSISDSDGNALSVALQPGSIAVSSVPEPPVIWLFAPSLACLAWLLRFRFSNPVRAEAHNGQHASVAALCAARRD